MRIYGQISTPPYPAPPRDSSDREYLKYLKHREQEIRDYDECYEIRPLDTQPVYDEPVGPPFPIGGTDDGDIVPNESWERRHRYHKPNPNLRPMFPVRSTFNDRTTVSSRTATSSRPISRPIIPPSSQRSTQYNTSTSAQSETYTPYTGVRNILRMGDRKYDLRLDE